MFDKWLYAIKHLPDLLEKPQILQEEIFTRLFDVADIARFTPKEVYEYEESLKVYRDWYSMTKTATDKAERKGIEIGIQIQKEKSEKQLQEERKESAKTMKEFNIPVHIIAEKTHLSIEEIEAL